MTDTTLPSDKGNPADAEDEISLLDLGIVIAKHKKHVVGLPAIVAVITAAIVFLLPNVYTATTKILPPQQGQSAASAMLAQLGSLAGLAGGVSGLKNPSDLYASMLKSRTVADNLVAKFDLLNYYGVKLPSEARTQLEKKTSITAGKDGIITIEVDDLDPKRAADMANAYVDELFLLTKVLAVTAASQRRLFFEQQFQQAKDKLAKAEVIAKQAIDKGGIANIDAQGRALIETTARLRAQISVKEVQIGAMHAYAADRNPNLLIAQQELAALKNELAKIEGTGNRDRVSGTASFDSLSLLRDVKYYETIYELLAKQYELAKIDEAKDSAVVQVMDKAIEPDRKSKPKRLLTILMATLATGFVAILWAFVREGVARAQQDPDTAERMKTLRQYLSWR